MTAGDDASEERYGLTWPGKAAAAALADIPAAGRLEPDEAASVDAATTGHVFAEGDCLDVLKVLRDHPAHDLRGRVGAVYLDPPYNTGSDFVYADSFADHAAWLSMMLPRLLVLRDLMAPDAVGFVSIDEHEVAQLKLLLAEVFGERNVVATIVWVSNLKGRQLGRGGPAGTHEYVLCFTRDADLLRPFRASAAELRELMPAVYKGPAYPVKHDARGPYVTKNELHNTNSRFNEQTAPTMVYRIHYHPDTHDVRTTDVDDETTFPGYLTALPHPNARDGLRWHAWRWSRTKVHADRADLEFDTAGGRLRIRTKVRDVDGMTLKDLVIGPSTVTGQADLEALVLGRVFDTPKPVALIETLLAAAGRPDDVVLDLFAGSATTAHAVLRRNARDGGRRRFVMVQAGEPCAPGTPAATAGFATIADVGRERVRRVGAVLRSEGDEGDVGFRALRFVPGSPARIRPDAAGR